MSDLQHEFNSFVDTISLGERQWARIESAYNTLHAYVAGTYNIPPDHVFIQGSCANGTAVKPIPGGEYDLDVVVVIPNGEATANAALDQLESILAANTLYAGKLTAKKPCIRIQYADDEIGGFHIDGSGGAKSHRRRTTRSTKTRRGLARHRARRVHRLVCSKG